MVGTSIGQYRLVRMIGEGGMGTVWLGEHALLGRRAAIKILLPEYTTNETIVQRFFNEARAVTAIADPGIVQVFDFGNTDGRAYIVMELLEGETMDARLRRIGRFAPADAVRLMAQIASSLGAAHAKGIVHRDLKPENVFIVGDPAVTGGERTKVLDFGIAKLASNERDKFKTRTGVVMGTPVYMSPEQCRGAATIDARSDIYALGCVLFTMLCGRPPFESEGSGDLIIMHVRDAPPVPSALVPGLVPEIDALLARCLEKDPARRFQTTSELVQGLAAVESALYGLPDHGFRQSLQMIPTEASGPVSSAGYQPRLTPAVALAYRQQHTPAPPDARTRIASPTPTTLGSATGAIEPAPSRKVGLIAGVAIGLIVIGGGAMFLLGRGGGGRAEPTLPAAQTVEAPPDAAAPVAVETPDAAPDAAPVVAETPDAAVVVDVPDAAPDAAQVAEPTTPKKHRPPKRPPPKGKGSNAAIPTHGFVDRGD